jgi:hypothetical protein
MVLDPGKRPLDPVVANALANQRQVRPRLGFNPLPGTFVSKHDGGRVVGVTRVAGAYGFSALIFKTPLTEDFDGAPDSYAPPTSATDLAPQGGLQMRERSIKNATNKKDPDPVFHDDNTQNEFKWTGVVSATSPPAAGQRIDDRPFLRDRLKRFPVFQAAGTALQDFYASQTAMIGADGRAVNALTVPYASLSTEMKVHGRVGLGDVGLAILTSTGASSGFIYADAGGEASTSVGEYSWKLARNLFGGATTSEDVCIIVFPGTSAGAVARPELIPRLLKIELEDLALFENVDELVERLATPQLGDPLFAGRRFIPHTGPGTSMKRALRGEDEIASANIRSALRRWGAR